MLKRINHIGLAVQDLGKAIDLFESAFQIRLHHREKVESQGIEIASFKVGDGLVELIGATGPDSVVANFLEKRGEGIHHIAFEVDDIGVALQHLDNIGLTRVDQEPRTGLGGSKIFFLHPKSTFGALLELVEPSDQKVR